VKRRAASPVVVAREARSHETCGGHEGWFWSLEWRGVDQWELVYIVGRPKVEEGQRLTRTCGLENVSAL
jgi:hypothetical protein